MPIGELLVGAAGLENRGVIACASHELQSYGKFLVGEAAGNGESGQAAKIADGAQRVGDRPEPVDKSSVRGVAGTGSDAAARTS